MSVPRRARCPTCRARRGEQSNCYRCGCDLRLLQAIEVRADHFHRAARRAYKNGFFRSAAARAATAVSLEATEDALRLLAVASIRAGDFLTGVRMARKLIANHSGEARQSEGPAESAAPGGLGPEPPEEKAAPRPIKAYNLTRRTPRRMGAWNPLLRSPLKTRRTPRRRSRFRGKNV